MNMPEGWPTEEMIEAGYQALLGVERSYDRRDGTFMNAVFRAMLAAAPTPPAQDDEPVAFVRRMINTQIIDSTGCKVAWEDLPDGTSLYTRPDNSGLRKAAWEALKLLDKLGSGPTIENLRAALEGK